MRLSDPGTGGIGPPNDLHHLLRVAMRMQKWSWFMVITGLVLLWFFCIFVINLLTGGALLWPFVRLVAWWLLTGAIAREFLVTFRQILEEER